MNISVCIDKKDKHLLNCEQNLFNFSNAIVGMKGAAHNMHQPCSRG